MTPERFTFRGRVEKGMGLGKKLGFPTFNLQIHDPLPLVYGVYAVQVIIDGFSPGGTDSRTHSGTHPALMHYGPKPTVGHEDIFCEVYILKFPSGLNAQELEVDVLGKIRDVMKFDGLEALVEQMKRDEAYAVENYFMR